jgi:hypothetical protein
MSFPTSSGVSAGTVGIFSGLTATMMILPSSANSTRFDFDARSSNGTDGAGDIGFLHSNRNAAHFKAHRIAVPAATNLLASKHREQEKSAID